MSDHIKYLPALGRLMIGAPFLMSGLGKIASYQGTVSYIESVGLPFATLGWLIAVIVEAGGGVLLLTGYRTRAVAFFLALFAVATAILFHRNFADQNQMIHFLKNIMLAGGLLQIASFGAGELSVDTSRARSSEVVASM
jgi:putative oxidoreductase